MIQAVLTDIEGTTTSISFVFDVLFPYARERLPDFIAEHGADPEVRGHLQAVSREAGASLDDHQAARLLIEWIDGDRKIGPLKALQGMLWKNGYQAGDFRGHVYEDAVRRLRQWHTEGLHLFVYSSGSVQAQRLLFGHSQAGDLSGLFEGYFDTRMGPKSEPASYDRIAAQIGLPAARILFLSDIEQELDAAAAAGMATFWLVRDAAADPGARHPQAIDFDAIRIPDRAGTS